jgi:hypothetical protein
MEIIPNKTRGMRAAETRRMTNFVEILFIYRLRFPENPFVRQGFPSSILLLLLGDVPFIDVV